MSSPRSDDEMGRSASPTASPTTAEGQPGQQRREQRDSPHERTRVPTHKSPRDGVGSSSSTGESALRPGEDQPMYSLFLANLDPSLRDDELADFFRKEKGGEFVFGAQVVLDRDSNQSKNFGYVHYTDEKAYKAALDEFTEVEIHGRLARCFAAEDKRKVYVRGLPRDMSEDKIKDEILAIAGKFIAINVRLDQGFCFVTYVNHVMAEKAMRKLEGAKVGDSNLHAEPAKPPKSRDGDRTSGAGGASSADANSALHIRNLAPESTQESIKAHFAGCGDIREVRLPKNRETGANSGFGFVEFETAGDAAAALTKLHHSTLDGRVIDVAFSRSKAGGAGRRDGSDDRRGGRGADRYAADYARGGVMPPMMGYPAAYGGYPAAGGRGGVPAFPYGYMPYGLPMQAAAGGVGGRGQTATAFPAAYGMPGGQAAYPYMDPRYMAQYALMAAQQTGMPGVGQVAGGAVSGGFGASAKKDRRRGESRSRSRSRSRSPKRGRSGSRSRSRSRDRKRR